MEAQKEGEFRLIWLCDPARARSLELFFCIPVNGTGTSFLRRQSCWPKPERSLCSSTFSSVAQGISEETRRSFTGIRPNGRGLPAESASVAATPDRTPGRARGGPLEEPAAVNLHGGSVREELLRARGDLNGHEAGNGGYSQRKPTALLASSTRKSAYLCSRRSLGNHMICGLSIWNQ
jgi:hypothetical protein